jgi:4-hydroxybenzoate polyprenyltransferase
VVGRKRRIDKWADGNPPIYLAAASPTLRDVIEAMRLYQWVKNLLIFAVLIANHTFTDLGGWTRTGLAFLAFGLCASSVYLLNDLLDLQLDRLHARKRERPFASGRLPLTLGLGLAALLLVIAAIIATFLPPLFVVVLATYFVTTSAYSLWLKRKVLVDVFVLASLYTLRVIAGAAAATIVPSFWLLAFSMFLFLSLAMVKRYAELIDSRDDSGAAAPGRGYNFADLEVLASLGASSAFTAVLVLALYINSDSVMPTYRLPEAIWLLCPLLLYWLSRLWILARRHRLDDDPIVFAAGDWVSQTVIALSGAVFLLAYFGLPSIFK